MSPSMTPAERKPPGAPRRVHVSVHTTSATASGKTKRAVKTSDCNLSLREKSIVLDPGRFSRNIVVTRKGTGLEEGGGEFEDLDVSHEGDTITISGTWTRLGAPQFSWQDVERRTVISIEARPRSEGDESSLELYFRIRDVLLGSFSEKVQGEFADSERRKSDDDLD